jgi:hypothetical protein
LRANTREHPRENSEHLSVINIQFTVAV